MIARFESLQKTVAEQAEILVDLSSQLNNARQNESRLREVLRPAVEAARERASHRIYNSECGKRNNVVLNCTRENDKALLEAGRILGVSDETI